MTKDEIIEFVYHDLAGYGSMQDTLKEAKLKDKSITINDVKNWFDKNVEKKRQLKGYNSFVASEPFQEFQIDIGFFTDLKDPQYQAGLFVIDIFTKYATIIPMTNTKAPTFLEALKKSFENMNGKPKSIYSDNEGSWHNQKVKEYLDSNDIKLIITLNHAHFVERFIRTIKSMIYKRIEAAEKKNNKVTWHELLYPVLLTYNKRMVHSATKFTPFEATKPSNKIDVKINLLMKVKHQRKYPELEIGDKVKVYKKRERYSKERISVWEQNTHTIEEISYFRGQPFYKVSGKTHQYSRSELLKVG